MFNLYISPLWVSVFLKGLAWVSPFEAVQINPPPTVIPDPFSVMVGNLFIISPSEDNKNTSSNS